MNDHGDRPKVDAQILAHALEKLRPWEGLTRSRVESKREAAPLLQLVSVRRHAAVQGIGIADAALNVVRQCVREMLSGTDQIVADAVLALSALADKYAARGIAHHVIDALRSDQVEKRRRALRAHWRDLHQALDMPAEEPPSDRRLRGEVEPPALAALARQLVQRERFSFGAMSAAPSVWGRSGGEDASASGRVLVVGGAVMDVTFRTKFLPQKDTSVEAHGFDLRPGGKGLTQAVAAARLGLSVSLVAAVGDDAYGARILEHLRKEQVDVSLVKVVAGARTAFTGIIELELGDSVAVNWRNEPEIGLRPPDADDLAAHIGDCDALLVTFEVSREVVQKVLSHVPDGETRPFVVVTPGQPYADHGRLAGQSIEKIDYMVAHRWELGSYAPNISETFDPDKVARRLLSLGVGTLCLPIDGGCVVYSHSLGTFTAPTFPSIYKEVSVARDAFCAALTARLIECDGAFSQETVWWATGAMAAATADYPLPDSMPTRSRIEVVLSRSARSPA